MRKKFDKRRKRCYNNRREGEINIAPKERMDKIMLKKLFKKETKKSNHYRVFYKWCGTDEIIEMFATSAGLATMDADPMIEIVEIKEV